MTESEIQIRYIEGQIVQRQLYAQLHMTIALTGNATRRNVEVGDSTSATGWRKMTPEELVDDSIQTATQHIRLIQDLIGSRDNLLRGKRL